MKYAFTAFGHQNILATHRTTLEITKDSELTKEGNCVVAVGADFSLPELKKFLNLKRIRVIVAADDVKDTVTAVPNKNFNSNHELVIRIGEFDSGRTFAVRADKAACNLNRGLVAALKSGRKAVVTVSEAYKV